MSEPKHISEILPKVMEEIKRNMERYNEQKKHNTGKDKTRGN